MGQLNIEYIEQLITKGLMYDKRYTSTVLGALENRLFETDEARTIYDYCHKHFNEYRQLPKDGMILNEIEDDQFREDVKVYLEDVKELDFEIPRNYDYLLNETDKWLRETSLKNAIFDSADILQRGDHEAFGKIEELTKSALTKTVKVDLGTDYFNTIGERLKRMFNATERKIPTGFAHLDEIFNGGFPPFTLNVALAKIHGQKSNFMVNMMARQALMGYNVVLFTLEMSEDMVAQRFDSIYSGMDINKMYIFDDMKPKLVSELSDVKNQEKRGNIFIKQFPTGTASVSNFRAYMHELYIRDIKPDLILCDYINLMKPQYAEKGNMYEDVKRIAEELRALSFEFEAPVYSVSQLNRGGMQMNLAELDFTFTSESAGIPATADSLILLGKDNDRLTYENELHYKIDKNRLGGRCGEMGKLWFDPRSLKLYDESEMDMWFEDAKKSGCMERNAYDPTDE